MGVFYSAAPELSPGGLAMVSPCEPIKYYLSSLQPRGYIGLKAVCFGGPSQAEILKAGASDAGFKALFRKKLKVVSSFLVVCCHTGAGVDDGTVLCLSLSYQFQCGVGVVPRPLASSVYKSLVCAEFLSEGIILDAATDSGCVWEEAISGLFYYHL